MKSSIDQERARVHGNEIFEQMHGFLTPETVLGVRDESEDGFVGQYVDEIYAAFSSLSELYSIPLEHPDIHKATAAFEGLLKKSGIKMFEYGIQYAIHLSNNHGHE